MVLFGIMMLFLFNFRFIFQLLGYYGIVLICLSTIKHSIIKKKSVKHIGGLIILFSMLNLMNHWRYFIYITDYFPNFFNSVYPLRSIIQFFWLIGSLWMLNQGVKRYRHHGNYQFNNLFQARSFRIVLIGICALILLETPIFGLHNGFLGEVHGHSFWNNHLHLH